MVLTRDHGVGSLIIYGDRARPAGLRGSMRRVYVKPSKFPYSVISETDKSPALLTWSNR
jgi:hypothetical protein